MINLVKVEISEKEMRAVNDVLKTGRLVEGPITSALEKGFTRLTKSKYAVATNSGTSALHTALYAVGVRPGDEVITTPFTFVATANSILMTGASPIFTDIDPLTYNIDPMRIKKAINKKTKAVIVVNLFGQPADFDSINVLVKNKNITIIEDAAQSINAEYKGKKSGNLADIACFSFYATKNLMSGEGGMITTNNKSYYLLASLFKNHGQTKKQKYRYVDVGYNYRMTDVLASIALTQLKKVKLFTIRRQKIASAYNRAFKNIKGLKIPHSLAHLSHVYHQYTLRITPGYKYTRDAFKDYLFRNGIQSAIYYPYPLYRFSHLAKGKIGDYPVSEQITKECLSIPIRPNLTAREIDYIIDVIANA